MSRRRLAIGVVLLGSAALVVTAALSWSDVRSVQGELTHARATLQRVVDDPGAFRTPEGRAATRKQMEDTVHTIDVARQRVKGSLAVRLTGFVPLVSRQRSGLISLLDDAATAAATGRDLLAAIDTLQGGTQIRDGSLPMDGLGQLAADVGAAGQRLGTLERPASGLWGPLGDARRQFNRVTSTSSLRLVQGGEALQAARSFLGSGGQKRHLLALQNNAEMRDQGMVLSYAVVRFDGGRLTVERSGSVGDLELDQPVPTALPPESNDVFGPLRPNQLWQSVNATADFGWSGRTMAEMYRQATGEAVEGVIAIDVPGLAALLGVVGPVEVEGLSEPISAANVGRILLHDLYEGLEPVSDQGPRRERLSDVVDAVVTRLATGAHDAVGLGRDLGQAAAGGHLRLWSPVAAEELVFERTGLGGGPATTAADRTFHLAVENRSATKLDYYVKPSVRQEVQLAEDGSAFVRTTVVIENQAPTGAPPSYQLGPDEFTRVPGEYLAWLLLWGPTGSVQRGGTPESGLVLSQHGATVDAGQSRELTFETFIPEAVREGSLMLRLVPQPRLEPVKLEVELSAPGWKVAAPTTWTGAWDRVITLTWPVER